MNLVLFDPAELERPLPLADPRAQHILKVLRRAPGDTFLAGLVDGPLGTATLLGFEPWHGHPARDSSPGRPAPEPPSAAAPASALALAFTPSHQPPPLPPITLLVGLPRPQTARDLLRDATTLGASCIHFIATERADPNYASSTLWTSGEWRRHLLAGAAQACDTRLPQVTWTRSLASALSDSALDSPPAPLRLALDNYEAAAPLASALSGAWRRGTRADSDSSSPASDAPGVRPLVLAFGPERGWGPADRAALRAAGFTLCSLGERVLRLETAVVAALSLAHFGQARV